MYEVRYSKRFVKEMKKLDKSVQKLVLNWIEKNLINCDNPRIKGKGLVQNRSGQWRYRIGNFRLICEIRDAELLILALSIGHRKNIYLN